MELIDGLTLMHEHMSLNCSPGDLSTVSFDELKRDLNLIYDHGVRNIVDLTNQTMGRAPEYVKRLSEETGINIIMSTGSYLEQYIEDYVRPRSVDELAADAVRDITEGIDGTDIKAEVIGEIAWSKPEEGPLEKKAWQAWVKAARETDAVVSTHPSRGIQQLPQARYLIENGVKPERIVIGHIEFSPDDGTLMTLLDTGVTIGLDMIGKESGKGDEFRADFVRKIKDWGRLRQLTLSLDICGREQLRSCGGYGYVHLFDTFIPMLKERGVTDGDIDLILHQNPVRILMKQ